MGRILSIVFLFLSFSLFSQTNLQGLVLDAKTREPLPYCAIAIKYKVSGCLTNEEGIFQLNANAETDTFLLSYVGYKPKQIAVNEFVKNTVILLDRKESLLNEVVVYSNDDYVYEVFETCRKKLRESKNTESKVYFVLESTINSQATELLESYYNGNFNNYALNQLRFKNGRAGLASYNDRFFINANTSKAFSFFNLLDQNEHLPASPFQYDKRHLKKYYTLKIKSVYDSEKPLYCIEFIPVLSNGKKFSGEVWIEKGTGELKKITLTVFNTKLHPFLPLFKETGTIKDASMQITRSYQNSSGTNQPDHIDFNYQLNYQHIHTSSLVNKNTDSSFTLNCKGLMYFYDFDKPFITPYFSYDSEMSDYRKITSLTYNEYFWTSNAGLVYSNKMRKGISYFKTNGILINYKNSSNTNFYEGKLFENNYIIWSEKKRISLKKNKLKNDTTLNTSSNGLNFITNQYQLKAQLFLDLNPMGDSIQHFSASIFDVYDTFYNLPEEPFTNCFINIYFDLFEIERRKMESAMSKNRFSATQIDSLYKRCAAHLETETAQYLKEVERGKNTAALEKWNNYVYEHLFINNMELFELTKRK
jgi:hypothetical protein